jgi:polyadenylate-binding protein
VSSNTWPRVDDDAALRAKVDEALSVYDEYMKGKDGEPGLEGTAKSSETVKEGGEEESS